MEYLRAQNHYTGDIRAIKNIARQMKVRIDKALRVLNNYGLFIVEKVDFHSPFLDEKMASMKRKRDKNVPKNAEIVSENVGTLSEVPCNSLETSDGSFKNKNKNNNNKKKKEETTTSSSKEAAAVVEPWERHIDSLRHEEQWKEIMAMRSGMGKDFIRRFDDVLQHFKQRNPATGERSYCGVPIPHDAPPRPNSQAVWNVASVQASQAFFKNDGAFRTKRRGVLKKRQGSPRYSKMSATCLDVNIR